MRDQRYLILRDEHRIPSPVLRYLWAFLRSIFRQPEGYPPAYHPVPDVLAARKEYAEAFSRHWRRYVGGGALVYTRSPEGRRILLNARAQRRPRMEEEFCELRV